MILVFGTVCIDRIRRVPFLPAPGGYVEIEDEVDMLGGEAANTAMALKRWGAEFTLLSNAMGTGPDGEKLVKLLEAHDLPYTTALPKGSAAAPTPVCDIFVTPDGDRTMYGRHFKDLETGLSDDALVDITADWFTAEPNMRDLARRMALKAKDAGMRLYLMDFLDEDIPVGSFWQGSTDAAGQRGNTAANMEWLQNLTARFDGFGILTDGPHGFVAGSPDSGIRHYPPFPAQAIVDTTGAGDAFRAGMLFGLDKEWPIHRCLQFASAAGCLSCRSLGATSDIPKLFEIEALIATHPQVADQYQ